MDFTQLQAISPLDGRYFSKTRALAGIFSEYGLIKARVTVEIRWLQTLANCEELLELPPFSINAKTFLDNIIDNFSLEDAARVKAIEITINHDVKAIEYFLQEKLALKQEFSQAVNFIHFGCTSEDINNLAYALMLKDARDNCLLPEIESLIHLLRNLAHAYAAIPMLAKTHGQPATPTTLGKEIANVCARLMRQTTQLRASPLLGKMNGAIGNYNAQVCAYPAIHWPLLSQSFVESLGLVFNPYTTQIEPHDFMAELFQVLSRINVILIDFARDLWGYISMHYFQQNLNENEVGSSTMPHKVNPIDFENAEGNLGLANALFTHFAEKLPISRYQRDLSDSTVLRNIGVAFAYSHTAYTALKKGLSKLKVNLDVLEKDLAEEWSLLAEAIQTVMRKHGLPSPYEQLKQLTRGKIINHDTVMAFIDALALPSHEKTALKKLTPAAYTGLATKLAKEI